MIDLNQIDLAPIRYDLDEIVRRLRGSAERWVPALFPKGRRQGDEWRLANIQGAPPRKSGSCVIMLRGDHAGDWHDFDGGQGGGPLATLAQGTGLADRALFAHAAGITGWQGEGPKRQEPPAAPRPERDASLDIAFIRDNAAPIQGTAAQRYLEGRGLIVPPDADLLFHPDLAHYTNSHSSVPTHPFPQPDGHDAPWLAHEPVPCVTAVINDVIVIAELAIG